MQKLYTAILTTAVLLCLSFSASADVKVKQRVTMAGQKFESTRMIKGSRERTEQRIEMADPQAATFFPQIATITQCDLKRTVRLNDRKQLYLAEPFQTAADTAPARPVRNEPQAATTDTRRGGTMTMSYAVKDTGERKTMFGLQARHLIITTEMETSADSCSGPTRMKMEYDGWYADFSAEFSCPIARPEIPSAPNVKPGCMDRIVYKGSSTGPKTGFLLEGTMTMFGTDGKAQMTQTTETLELSRSPLDASLFDIPMGYREAGTQQELYAISMPTAGEITNRNNGSPRAEAGRPDIAPVSSAKRVAVTITYGKGSVADRAEVDRYIRTRIASRGLRAVDSGGDYSLTVHFDQIKESAAGKIGGLFGKVTGVDAKVGKVDIDMTATLTGGSSNSAKVKSKFDGPIADAVRAALDQALDQILDSLPN